ncbi:MAG: hypothetical protein BM556_06065 [Bacteriovorax sp. MedPE-SWde]|nr:MAG: hypothetical protein BM556_06065 [Bacteriovorax sp. MedPE-SWde]
MTKENEVTCSTCKALCCRLEVQLIDDSDDQVPEEYTTKVDGIYTAMKQADDGWCLALDRRTMLCKIYEKRPFICRDYKENDYDCLIEREKLQSFSQIALPVEFSAPIKVIREKYFLEVLSSKHNKADFEAWSSSIDELKGVFGPNNPWPEDVTDLSYNLKDLENHHKEFLDREAFTYSILERGSDLCIGCLYIRPCSISEYDCRVDFWFRTGHTSHVEEFYQWLKKWLLEYWGFDKPVFPGRSISWNDYNTQMEK